MGQTALLSFRRKECCGFFSPWKIRRLRPGLKPRNWVPKASTLLLDHRSRLVGSTKRLKICTDVCKSPDLLHIAQNLLGCSGTFVSISKSQSDHSLGVKKVKNRTALFDHAKSAHIHIYGGDPFVLEEDLTGPLIFHLFLPVVTVGLFVTWTTSF